MRRFFNDLTSLVNICFFFQAVGNTFEKESRRTQCQYGSILKPKLKQKPNFVILLVILKIRK